MQASGPSDAALPGGQSFRKLSLEHNDGPLDEGSVSDQPPHYRRRNLPSKHVDAVRTTRNKMWRLHNSMSAHLKRDVGHTLVEDR